MSKQLVYQWSLIIKHKLRAEEATDEDEKRVHEMIAGHLQLGLIRKYGFEVLLSDFERLTKAIEYTEEVEQVVRQALTK